ncbi:hypothetical protein [Sorangium sp. So ce1335]|uniref:hypothetical protein n=1 Tax=Sorangium sp. So ce1335 TaxID=3133335 RepID=UPI003F6085E8
MKTMAFGMAGEIFVVVHGDCGPSDEEWDRYVDAWITHFQGRPRTRTLIVTDGGSPNPSQWQRMVTNRRLPDFYRIPSRYCVVTDSTFVRGVMGGMDAPGLSPFSGRYKLFPRGQLVSALRELDASPFEERTAVSLVDELRETLGKR